MQSVPIFRAICDAMVEPAFYPHPVDRVELRETHISAVFLAGEWVYKLKKPVDFGFLDFLTLDARRHFCRREVALNQRLTRGIYEEVVSICRDHTGRFVFDHGEPVEYAVKMKRLPDEANLTELLRRRAVTDDDLKALGRHLAEFYSQSDGSPEIDHFGDPEVIAFNMEENFRQVGPFVDEALERDRWDFIRQVSRTFFRNRHMLFKDRVSNRRIRDGHGDLRTEHIYFYGGIQVIDCIEFNDRFRYGDVVSDLSFLVMDLESLGYPDVSRAVISTYIEHSGDYECYSLLDFYTAYRAIVKLKVALLRTTEIEAPEERDVLRESAGSYMGQAYRYALQFSRPTLWVFCGLPASGKSMLAEALAKALSLSLFQSDRIRKEGKDQALQEEIVPFDQGIYRTAMRQRVYARMLAFAQDELKKGHPAILDATFSRTKWREEARQLAVDLDTNLIFVECFCRLESIRERLKQREQRLSISDARLQHLNDMVKNFEPLREVPETAHIRLDTDQPFERSFLKLLSEGHALRCAQVRQVLENSTT